MFFILSHIDMILVLYTSSLDSDSKVTRCVPRLVSLTDGGFAAGRVAIDSKWKEVIEAMKHSPISALLQPF